MRESRRSLVQEGKSRAALTPTLLLKSDQRESISRASRVEAADRKHRTRDKESQRLPRDTLPPVHESALQRQGRVPDVGAAAVAVRLMASSPQLVCPDTGSHDKTAA